MARYRRAIDTGLLTFTTELSGGRDAPTAVLYPNSIKRSIFIRSRRWGLATQYRRFHQGGRGRTLRFSESSPGISETTSATPIRTGSSSTSSGNWSACEDRRSTIVTLQYYFYR